MQIDQNILTEISALNEGILILSRQASEPGFFFKREDDDLKRKRSRLDYLVSLVEWYKGQATKVLTLVHHQTITITHDLRLDGDKDSQEFDSRQLAESLLDDLQRSHDIYSVLPAWCKLLIHRGLLSPEAAAGLDLTAPVDTARLARESEAKAKEAEFQAGYNRLYQAVQAYAKSQNNDWWQFDLKDAYSANPLGIEHSEKGLLELAKTLGQRRLLPIGDRVKTSLAELFSELKGWAA